jgi:hypothetical protein
MRPGSDACRSQARAALVALDGTKPDPFTLRLFVEGVPTAATANDIALMQSVGGEKDSSSRQLGRFVQEVAPFNLTNMNVRVIWRRDRYLRARLRLCRAGGQGQRGDHMGAGQRHARYLRRTTCSSACVLSTTQAIAARSPSRWSPPRSATQRNNGRTRRWFSR